MCTYIAFYQTGHKSSISQLSDRFMCRILLLVYRARIYVYMLLKLRVHPRRGLVLVLDSGTIFDFFAPGLSLRSIAVNFSSFRKIIRNSDMLYWST